MTGSQRAHWATDVPGNQWTNTYRALFFVFCCKCACPVYMEWAIGHSYTWVHATRSIHLLSVEKELPSFIFNRCNVIIPWSGFFCNCVRHCWSRTRPPLIHLPHLNEHWSNHLCPPANANNRAQQWAASPRSEQLSGRRTTDKHWGH